MHIDGLRVDAVASMLYLDYSREEGDWIPNEFGGNENIEAIEFMRDMNEILHSQVPGILTIAEESTSWPQVSRPTYVGGLGFDMKWNMGWMNDTLRYMGNEPVHRQYHQDMLTFSMIYAFTENFLLPFSHDEVVHGKQSMLHRMPGDEWQRHANLRALYTYMFTHPGKKLLFMGTEFGQGNEWNSATVLDWFVLDYPLHQGMRQLVKDLNGIYQSHSSLYDLEFTYEGFEWINCTDAQHSVLSFLRKDEKGDFLVVVLNLTPIPRPDYRIGVPGHGDYLEIFNSDSEFYGGSNLGNGPGPLSSEEQEWDGRPYSLSLTLPPLAGIILKPDSSEKLVEPEETEEPASTTSV
jgi:1,4-alpha-glucan branching enzyme